MFIKLTNYVSRQPVWVNPHHIVLLNRGPKDKHTKIVFVKVSYDFELTQAVQETPEEIFALIAQGNSA